MTLYFYEIGTDQPVLTVENAQSYTADSVTAADGTVYAPLAEGYELSGKADCSETLRARGAAESGTGRGADRRPCGLSPPDGEAAGGDR